jgi:hypothetical protein
MFLKKFHHRSDIGREYFQGDPKHMMKTIFDFLMSFSDPMMEYTPPPILNKQPLDPTIVVMEFVDEYRAELSKKIFKTKDLYTKLSKFIQVKQYSIVIAHSMMMKVLMKSYAAKCKTHRFEAQHLDQALLFPNLISEDNDTQDDTIDTTPINVDNVQEFIKEYIKEDDNGYFTLKEAKQLLQRGKHMFNDGKVISLKNDLKKALKTVCCDQKWINGKNEKNVYMGYSICLNNDINGIDELEI